MAIKKTLGGDRLGAGKKNQVHMHGYERSTHDLGYIWRSTMAAGTLVPFMVEIGLPGDTFDIELDCDIQTNPTIGPLFGSYKVQLDVFETPIRLYNGLLQNNKVGIGMHMDRVKLPLMRIDAPNVPAVFDSESDLDNSQINPSSIFAYLGIRGIGGRVGTTQDIFRRFNAVPYLTYWDIYKNYYANKQEEVGAVLRNIGSALVETVTTVQIFQGNTAKGTIVQAPAYNAQRIANGDYVRINYTGAVPKPEQILVAGSEGGKSLAELFAYIDVSNAGYVLLTGKVNPATTIVTAWYYQTDKDLTTTAPKVEFFPLENLDTMRENILTQTRSTTAYEINQASDAPYGWPFEKNGVTWAKMGSQEGLALKTYQSDQFNNWISTEYIDGDNGINAITAIDTSSGSFTIDTLNLSRKVYDMMNRVAMSGGTYDDWQDVTYDHSRMRRAETPMYMGGLSKELVFQEVVSTAETTSSDVYQPLGTLAGRGRLSGKHKGGKVTVKVDEPSYLMGIVSLTPRVDYSQGNKWDTNLKTLNDLHKPGLDEIGFQDLIVDQMAWWSTLLDENGDTTFVSRGKQPAWLNYMTNVNVVRGNFAIKSMEMFMTLNRRYELTGGPEGGADITTYIDPMKFNHIFAETARDAQNFRMQISVDITARRKMSARLMPNL